MVYAVPIGPAKSSDETPIYRNIEYVESLAELPDDEPKTIYELLQRGKYHINMPISLLF
jgi:hypothetical protein